MRERIVKAGHALLTLKEIEHLGAAQPGGAIERLPRLLDHLLRPLEQEWVGGRREPDTMGRVKRLRAAILPDMVHGELGEEESARRQRQIADLYVAQQLHCYSGDYLADDPTPERLLETVERYEEDLTDAAHPHPPTHAVISVGEAIEASPTRDRNAGNDFFFSGHTALVVLAAIEAAHLALPWFAVFVAVIAVGEMITVLVLWAHYTMDVLAGAFAAFLAPNVAGKLSPTVDAWLR